MVESEGADKKFEFIKNEISYIKNISIPHLKEMRLTTQKKRNNLKQLLKKDSKE